MGSTEECETRLASYHPLSDVTTHLVRRQRSAERFNIFKIFFRSLSVARSRALSNLLEHFCIPVPPHWIYILALYLPYSSWCHAVYICLWLSVDSVDSLHWFLPAISCLGLTNWLSYLVYWSFSDALLIWDVLWIYYMSSATNCITINYTVVMACCNLFDF